MTVQTIKNAPILLFNKNHKNFTESDDYIPDGSEINGEVKIIEGNRRGNPFTYRLFITNDNKIIFLNKTNYKDMTDVRLGVDGQTKVTMSPNPIKTETTINLPGTLNLGKKTIYGGVLGAITGFAYCKYKKHDNQKTMYYTLGGLAIGGVLGYLIESNVITVKKA
jgi:hypothetical protein